MHEISSCALRCFVAVVISFPQVAQKCWQFEVSFGGDIPLGHGNYGIDRLIRNVTGAVRKMPGFPALALHLGTFRVVRLIPGFLDLNT